MDIQKFARENIIRMKGYVPGEQPGEKRVTKLNTNENPYPPSPRVLEAIRSAASDELRLYPPPMADRLLEAAAEVYGVPPDHILAGNGSDELLSILTRVFVGENDRVAYPIPTYTLYETLCRIQGGSIVEIPFPEDFSFPEELLSSGAKMIFLANPNSPSGTVIEPGEIERVARSFDGVLVVDEAYADFAGVTCIPLVKELKNVVVLRTFSKSFSLAGIRLGLAFAHPEVVKQMVKVKDSYNVNALTQAAGLAALKDVEWMRKNVGKIVRTRERLSRELERMGFRVYPSRANFVLARMPGKRVDWIFAELKKRNILVRYFDAPMLEECLRITVGTDEEIDSLLKELETLVK